MSCRILGRYLESWTLNEIKKLAIKKKISYILAEYIPTKRNEIAKDFLVKSNFNKIDKKKLKRSIKNLTKEIFQTPSSECFIFDTNKKIPNIEIYE